MVRQHHSRLRQWCVSTSVLSRCVAPQRRIRLILGLGSHSRNAHFFLLSGVHVSKVDTLSLARAKAFSELTFAGLSLVVAGFLGGQGANFAR